MLMHEELGQYHKRMEQIHRIASEYKNDIDFDPDKLGPMLVRIGELYAAIQAIEIIARVTLENVPLPDYGSDT